MATFAVLPLLLSFGAPAEGKLADIFQSGMVLQRGNARLYGTAAPGEKLTITVGTAKVSGRADRTGQFDLKLKTPAPGGPYVVKLVGDGGSRQELKDVLVGDVWVCSGQSNMEWEANWFNGRRFEIGASDFSGIRLFKHGHRVATKPQAQALGSWVPANVTTARNFSLVGFLFGREIHQKTKVPIGLIESAWGGTPAESWIDLAGLKGRPELASLAKKFEGAAGGTDADQASYTAKVEQWLNTVFLNAKVPANFIGKDLTLPGAIEKQGMLMDGVVWVKRTVEVPASLAGKDLTLELGPIDDFDVTYWNGETVGNTSPKVASAYNTPRKYTVPGRLVKAGSNEVAIRVFDTGGDGGPFGDAESMRVGDGQTWIPLAGKWRSQVEADFAETNAKARLAPPEAPANANDPWLPTGLYNGMIASLIPFNVRGAIWYQGESNVGRAAEYSVLFPAMIESWRRTWNNPNLDFYFVQLAAYGTPQDSTTESGWADLRESQLAALKLPRTGMAVAIDAGEEKDIHPIRKDLVGQRLAATALAKTYGLKVEYLGPSLRKVERREGQLVLHLDHAKGLKSLDGAPLKGFAVAGADGKFFVAEAKIDGEKLLVTSAQVPNPVQVRYAWADYVAANLGNGAGLPAAPFRGKLK